jgi:hypothetical protein
LFANTPLNVSIVSNSPRSSLFVYR